MALLFHNVLQVKWKIRTKADTSSLAYNISARTAQKRPVSFVTCVSAAAGTCLPSCYPETGLVCSPISRLLHSNGTTRNYTPLREFHEPNNAIFFVKYATKASSAVSSGTPHVTTGAFPCVDRQNSIYQNVS
jgi:hypothetical protein